MLDQIYFYKSLKPMIIDFIIMGLEIDVKYVHWSMCGFVLNTISTVKDKLFHYK